MAECKWAAKDFLKYSCKLGEATNDHASNFWSGWSALMVDNLPQGTYLEGEARDLDDDTVVRLVSSSITGTTVSAPQPLVKYETTALCGGGKKGLYYKSSNTLGGSVAGRKFVLQLVDSPTEDARASDLLSSDCDGTLNDWGKIAVHACGDDSFLDSASRAVFEEVASTLSGSAQVRLSEERSNDTSVQLLLWDSLRSSLPLYGISTFKANISACNVAVANSSAVSDAP